MVERTKIDARQIEDVIIGCVTETDEQGACVARAAVLAAGWPVEVPGVTLNRFCGSGQTAVNLGAQAVAAGAHDVVYAGGVESMTRVPMGADMGAIPASLMTKYDLVPQGLAAEMVAYFGRLYGMGDDELDERMEQLFERFQMREIRDVLGAKMSTGMKQKVSIARAIVHDPPVLIFDEATTGLDVLVARALLDAVAELRDQGKCIVFSTHIMREAERLCDRIAIMHRGHILAEGTLEELRDEHHESDLEELFFRLIRAQEAELAASIV